MSYNTTTGGVRCSTGGLFSQLRQLAIQVESGIGSLQTKLGSTRVREGVHVEHTQAVNFLLHMKKDIADLRDMVATHLVEFSRDNSKIDRVCELMSHIQALHSEHLERVESHFQKYGYKKPVLPSNTMAENCTAIIDGRDKSPDVNVSDDESEQSDNRVISKWTDSNRNDSAETQPCQAACDKPADYNVMLTPKLEDLYSHLSEETLSLIKHGARSTSHSEVPPQQNTTLKASSNSLALMKTPEPPVLLSGMFNGINRQLSAVKVYDSTLATPKLHTPAVHLSHFSSREVDGPGVSNKSMAEVSAGQVKIPALTPEVPILFMSRLQTESAVNAVHTEAATSAKSFFHTPPTPELKTCAFRRKGLSLNEKNVHMSQTAGFLTPEAPKLYSVASLSTPEAPKLFSMTGLSTPEVPKLFSMTDLSTPEVPKLLMRGHNLSHYAEN